MQFSKEWLETDAEPSYFLEEPVPYTPPVRMSRINWAGEGFTVRNEESST